MPNSKRPTSKNQSKSGKVIQFVINESHLLEAERSVLGGLMLNDEKWTFVQSILSVDDFYLQEHQVVFTAIKAVIAKGDHPDPITLADYLQSQENLETIGGGELLGKLVKSLQSNTPSASNLLAYARIVRKNSLLRQKEEAHKKRCSARELLEIEKAIFSVDNPDSGDKSQSLETFTQQEITARELILDPIMTTHSETIVYAEPGVGKTLFITDLAFAIACGGHAIKWPVTAPRKVLIVDGEMPVPLLMERYDELIERNNGLKPEYMRIVSALDYDGDMDLITPEWQQVIDHIIEKHQIEVLFLDNLSALFNLDQVKQPDWTPAKLWLKRLRNMGLATILVHHSNKQKTIFGTSALSRQPDNIIALLRPEDYSQEEGAVFDVCFEKARGLFGDAIAPFRTSLNAHGWLIENDKDLQLSDELSETLEAITGGYDTPKKAGQYLDVKPGTIRKRFITLKRKKLIMELDGIYVSVNNVGNAGNGGNAVTLIPR